ncbi:MAG: nucleotidyltransferase domain-containing protein [Thermomicrobiales bacterium]
MVGSPDCYAAERDALLATVLTAVQRDPRVTAVWLAGSIGRGSADRWSDLDLWLVIEDRELPGIIADPSAFVNAIVPVTMAIRAPQNAPPQGAYLLTWTDGELGPQQIDWYWQPASTATRGRQTRLLFERVPVPRTPVAARLPARDLEAAIDAAIRDALLMAFIGGKHIRRGDQWAVVRHLEHLARCAGTLEWLLTHGYSPAFEDRLAIGLPAAIPVTPEEQRVVWRSLVRRIRALIEQSGRSEGFGPASESLRVWERTLGD